MKKFIWIFLTILIFTLPVSAQEWRTEFFEDFEENYFNWPLGTETQSAAEINRVIKESDYIWTVKASEPNLFWMSVGVGYPADSERYRFSAEIQLPEFDPVTCAGIQLDTQGSSFYGYVICNDKTYSLLHVDNGNVETLIPYTPLKDFDNFSAFSMAAEINDGWADLYYNGENLDTYNIGFNQGSFGMIAMPQTTEATEIAFGGITFESSAVAQETTFDAAAVDPNASVNTARLVKMLNLKERIVSTAGTFMTLPERELSLAMMGYSSREGFGINSQNLLLETDISWASGFERPDYAASGCGFYLRGADAYSYIEVYAAMDGGVHVNGYRNGEKSELTVLNYDNWSISGKGRLGVAADGRNITVLWNDSILGTMTAAGWTWSGDAGYVIHSGTNGDFGTRCVFSNGEGYLFN